MRPYGRIIFITLFAAGLIVAYCLLLRIQVIPDGSLEPAYQKGDVVVLRRAVWPMPDVRPGDVVMVRAGSEGSSRLVRVHKVGGEQIDAQAVGGDPSERRAFLDRYTKLVSNTPNGTQVRYEVPQGFVSLRKDDGGQGPDKPGELVSLDDILAVAVLPRPHEADTTGQRGRFRVYPSTAHPGSQDTTAAR